MKIISLVVIGVLALLLLAACAPTANNQVNVPNAEGKVAGFWQGLWHGIISPVTFVISLFNHSVTVYEVHNNGGWYNFGFLLGIGAFAGGGGSAASRRRS